MQALKPARKPKGLATCVRESEARARERGGRRLPGGTLPPPAADALAKLQASGYAESATACIARAVVDAANRIKSQ